MKKKLIFFISAILCLSLITACRQTGSAGDSSESLSDSSGSSSEETSDVSSSDKVGDASSEEIDSEKGGDWTGVYLPD